jgi:MerR family transcriptional regulator, copper efflux regulator
VIREDTDLLSGELARLAGVSTDTLRHYERVGVLPRPPRTGSGYRRYPASAVDRVRLIRRALAIGFSLDELRRILQSRDRGGVPCQGVRALAASKLSQLEQRIAELEGLRDQLRGLLIDWDGRLARTPDGQPARLLESL